MGRTKKSAPTPVEPEEESQDVPDEEMAAEIEQESAGETEGDGPSKSEAARQAIKAGYQKPGQAVGWIKETFGIDMNPQHFSSIKSGYLKKQGAEAPVKASEAARRGPKPKSASQTPAQASTASAPKLTPAGPNGDPDLMDALIAMKPLIAQYGAEKVKQMVDLLG